MSTVVVSGAALRPSHCIHQSTFVSFPVASRSSVNVRMQITMTIPGHSSCGDFVKDMNTDKGVASSVTGSSGVVEDRKQTQLYLFDDDLSTTAIHQSVEHRPARHREHIPNQRNERIQDSPREFRSILRSPPPRGNSRHHLRSPSLTSSILSSSILSSVYSLVSPSKENTKSETRVRFSFPDTEAEFYSSCRRLSILVDDKETITKVHRRSPARMCMLDILFELDINDFHPDNKKVSIPTLLVIKRKNHASRCHSSQREHPKPRSPHQRRTRYAFTV